ncbi:alkaline shock response membrane anchor protein AmaP [Fusobacterium pseudoperiodonticum]|uniref:Alkaline shock response membrane anchor protein AmaP n=1 Tax=Fusobacterium pseudoperiodonticum TaxID=2663009 RepID=A0A2D3PQ07_9FUSO|nr:alkaline shock response membrane anchor protein AmaP [Fusobacterium pseudoperiodonticum]ATV69730.1 alkaline shock response membrane anchor protein AmaP [Fusobacterium pseudoperiodonticum]MBF1213564.1 alkaline shock response membrane anchor protein AmaP [Fusobacterium periodonticum]MBS5868956.1 alkaline shock response membrane anchor protein AmaP [Fusobacterium periodonticum]
MLKKLIFFFAWIGIFLISLVALNYILLPGQIVYDNPFAEKITSFQYKMVILVLAALYLFICIIKFFSLFERKKDYERKTENGTLKISKATINNYVMDLLRRDPDITGIKTVSELKGNKFLINIKCELLAKMNIANKISYLQNLIKTDLMENLGVDVNKVVVNIVKIEAREKEKTNDEASNEVPAVNVEGDNVEVNN